jgi:hypothetical protein
LVGCCCCYCCCLLSFQFRISLFYLALLNLL